ncbi:MAG: DUF1549 domain-containing protein [Planctomycetaceae bacterium]|nr:DUF1549 domain-containing protein [Planctomycetaceae bacterium]
MSAARSFPGVLCLSVLLPGGILFSPLLSAQQIRKTTTEQTDSSGDIDSSHEIDFSHDIVPILRRHCVECHGGREAKGSFSLNTRQLLIDSGNIDADNASESQLLQLLQSDDPEVQMPPKDRPRVTADEQRLLLKWIEQGTKWEDGFSFAPVAWEPPLLPRRPDLPGAINGREHPVDRILDHSMQQAGIPVPAIVDDETFLRRVSLDLVGLLPSPERRHQFLMDPSPNKREKLIDELLSDNVAWADHWLTFFNDLLRNDYSGTGFITGGRAQVSTWLYESLLQNKPFDVMARELIAPPTPASQGYIDGIRWRGNVSAGQTVEIQFAQSVSQSFLGINMKCASCHDSFIDRWKLDEAYGLAAIYASAPLEIHRCDKPIGRTAEARWLFPELGQIDPSAPREQRLQQLAALMTHPNNGRFSRTIVNRLWYKLTGRGIVHPMDAMQTKPWNEDLLDFLAVTLTDHNYDLKAVVRLIATSRAYQSQTVSLAEQPTEDYVFRGPLTRRMTAEQFMDGLWQLTGTAPSKMDAPVFRAIVDEAGLNDLQLKGSWIWGDSAADGRTPKAGETISLRKTLTLDQDVDRGGAVITCDNSFVLYLNGRQIAKGDDWTQPQAVALQGLLRKGDNQIVVVATNAGSGPNPAALYFEAQLILSDGTQQSVTSDASWEFNPRAPAGREGRLGGIPGPWKPAIIVPALPVWQQTIDSSAKTLLAQAASGNVPMIRASLMKNDFLMKSLGRPLRDQIVSMRPAELTTLEALDLANGDVLTGSLKQGAEHLLQREWTDREELVDYLYAFALSRSPTPVEQQTVLESMDDVPTPQQVEDILWAILMTPEFLLVR